MTVQRLTYRGDGAFRPGLPARDIDRSDLEALGATQKRDIADIVAEAVGSGLYVAVEVADDPAAAAASDADGSARNDADPLTDPATTRPMLVETAASSAWRWRARTPRPRSSRRSGPNRCDAPMRRRPRRPTTPRAPARARATRARPPTIRTPRRRGGGLAAQRRRRRLMGEVVEVIGMERVLADLNPARFAQFPHALKRGGLAIQAEMQQVARTHHDLGNLERQIHVEGPTGSGLDAQVRVGISTKAAPEGRPLAFGWASASGKQPPVEAIARWLTRHPEAAAGAKSSLNRTGSDLVFRTSSGKVGRHGSIGFITSEASIRTRAFLIARAIGRRGYSFGRGKEHQRADWFHEGIKAGRPKLEAIIRAALRVGR
jgi:hypothetical protein